MTNKTAPTEVDVDAFIDSVEHPVRREDARTLLRLMTEVSGQEPVMWGPSLIGFGSYHYRYESGREGDFFRIGFSPRKARQVLYIMTGFDDADEVLGRLGKYRTGKSCLYVNKLADVDLRVLRELCERAWAEMRQRYPVG